MVLVPSQLSPRTFRVSEIFMWGTNCGRRNYGIPLFFAQVLEQVLNLPVSGLPLRLVASYHFISQGVSVLSTIDYSVPRLF